MRIIYELDDLLTLTDLADATLGDAKATYLHNRFCNDLEQYRTFCGTGDLHVAGDAKSDARDDLYRLLLALDDTFEFEDAEFLLGMYIPEYMKGWTY